MLWYAGLFLLALWVIEKFLLHKGGFVHTLLLAAISCFVVQLVQDRRTKAYREEARRQQ
jgi:uncharacterized membrane protein YiaA